MSRLVIDTNFLVANIDRNDKWHNTVVPINELLNRIQVTTIYLDCVINETVSVLAKRMEEKNRLDEYPEVLAKIQNVIPYEKITWTSYNNRFWYGEILDLLKEHKGRISFNDALIALYLKNSKIKYLVSFDKDFDKIPWITRLGCEEDFRKQDELIYHKIKV